MKIPSNNANNSEDSESITKESRETGFKDIVTKEKEPKLESNVKRAKINKSFEQKPEEISAELKIPKERVAILIGKDGSVKNKISDLTQTRIEIDSKEGDVTIRGEDGLRIFEAREVVRAVGRGFNPDVALKLLDPEYLFDILRISDYATTKNSEIRLKGRLIGTSGKTRSLIETLSEANVSVYGKTVSMVGKLESVNIAKRAVIMILNGSPHSTVYNWLEKNRKTLKQKELEARDMSEFIEELE